MDTFAKIFETQLHGQMCAIAETNDDGAPSIQIYFKPPGLGVSSISFALSDTDDGWDRRDKIFTELTEAQAISVITSAFNAVLGDDTE